MNGLSSTESFLGDVEPDWGLLSWYVDPKRGINSSEFVMNEILSDRRMQAAAIPVSQAEPGLDENTPNISVLNPVSSVDGAQINHAPSLQPFPPAADDGSAGSVNDRNSSHSKKKNRRERVLDMSTVCVPTDDDVLFGRGGDINKHPGNIFFRKQALSLRTLYEESSKEEKFKFSEILLKSVKGGGGRFLEKDGDGLWRKVSGNGARKKASQALRERIKGRGASARSQDSPGDERDDTGAD
ncbi:hypothetical protein HJC23_007122 [Cyclotella cryptica]|uniref:DUF6824 domain-containing protein n=1 Tax=Cyclotella cryptica TaxID=29204 RepID=A0ABD3P2I8_9STRA